jgi:hypothetical protein
MSSEVIRIGKVSLSRGNRRMRGGGQTGGGRKLEGWCITCRFSLLPNQKQYQGCYFSDLQIFSFSKMVSRQEPLLQVQ